MSLDVEESRRSMLNLLEQTRCETRSALSCLDAARVIHDDERLWRVRDIVGHLAVWNGEAARSLAAYAGGAEYTCIDSNARYDEYNGPAAEARKVWTLEEVWAEYEATHDQLAKALQDVPADRWNGDMVFPWTEHGTVQQLIECMMRHEKIDHCELVARVIKN